MTVDWASLGKALADSAPVIGGVLCGPAGGMAGALIASALGTKNDPEAILAQINADPETLAKIKQLEIDERDHIREWQLVTLQAELSDIQNARAAHAGHWMPSAITVCLGAMVCVMGYFLLTKTVPTENKDMAVYLLGQIAGLFTGAVSYWIGTSRSSYNKDQALMGAAR